MGDNIVKEVSGTGECIDACENTKGCKYWTVGKRVTGSNRVNCQLRQWKGKLTQNSAFVSGSLPSACYQDVSNDDTEVQDSESDDISLKQKYPCLYKDLEFSGGDLVRLNDVEGFEACKSRCEDLKDCHFFSLSKELNCQLKNKEVAIIKNPGT